MTTEQKPCLETWTFMTIAQDGGWGGHGDMVRRDPAAEGKGGYIGRTGTSRGWCRPMTTVQLVCAPTPLTGSRPKPFGD